LHFYFFLSIQLVQGNSYKIIGIIQPPTNKNKTKNS
jgi:hypothetical protein